jgi:Icc-related predicted phosphoesterase
MKFAWLSDIHTNSLNATGFHSFLDNLKKADLNAILIGGDIAESHNVVAYLEEMEKFLKIPIYFVLGNHDYYRSSIAETRKKVGDFSKESEYSFWLPESSIIKLGSNTALIGHGSWADTQFGDYQNSFVELNDYYEIRELTGLSKLERKIVMMGLAEEAAIFTRQYLTKALEIFDHVYFLTHVPPFRESTWHKGKISDDYWMPHFSCKVVGDVMLDIMQQNPEKHLTVLCGHTHSSGEAFPLQNITVYTGHAEYGVPEIQKIFEL